MIVCSECGGESSVKDSRPAGVTIRRRRRCDKCGLAWTTFEIDREAILKLRAASRLFTAMEDERKRIAELIKLVSEFDDLEALASSGRGPSKQKRKLKPRQPKISEVISDMTEIGS